ncbi:MAG: TolA-binding protein [Candidatus Paceibacteria bacterium]|jgi:TolA-binding protein
MSPPIPMQRHTHALLSTLKTLVTGGFVSALLCAPTWAQGGRPDQVFLTDSSRQVTGVVTENGLINVVLDQDGKERRLDGSNVERIIWGNVSSAFREGQDYFGRGDYENAAAKFTLAASDDERGVIQAIARRRAGESLMYLGATDPSHFDGALDQFVQFLSDYPGSRDVPSVRSLQARAMLLRGNDTDLKQAGTLYRQLFEAGTGAAPTPGYDRSLCALAGLDAIRTLTAAGETLGAREIAGVLTTEVNALLAAAVEDSPEQASLKTLAAEVQLSEGFVLLASEQARQAETFFNSQIAGSKDQPSALRFGAMLGLGMAQTAQAKHREASVNFATVASIDFTNRDRSALALLHLAETMIQLGDKGATGAARLRLTALIDSFGDTPSASAARKVLETL